MRITSMLQENASRSQSHVLRLVVSHRLRGHVRRRRHNSEASQCCSSVCYITTCCHGAPCVNWAYAGEVLVAKQCRSLIHLSYTPNSVGGFSIRPRMLKDQVALLLLTRCLNI